MCCCLRMYSAKRSLLFRAAISTSLAVCNVTLTLKCVTFVTLVTLWEISQSVTALFNAFARCSPLSTFLGKCLCIQDNYERDSSRKNNFDKFCSSICIYQKLFVSLQPNLDFSSIWGCSESHRSRDVKPWLPYLLGSKTSRRLFQAWNKQAQILQDI